MVFRTKYWKKTIHSIDDIISVIESSTFTHTYYCFTLCNVYSLCSFLLTISKNLINKTTLVWNVQHNLMTFVVKYAFAAINIIQLDVFS